jgi:hypothetical protein
LRHLNTSSRLLGAGGGDTSSNQALTEFELGPHRTATTMQKSILAKGLEGCDFFNPHFIPVRRHLQGLARPKSRVGRRGGRRCGYRGLFTVGKSLISWYIGSSAVASSYGAAGALMVLLLWVYYSAQIFLLGAEFTKVYANRHGSKRADQVSEMETRAV